MALGAMLGKKKSKEDPNAGLKKMKADQERRLSDLKYYISNILVKKDSLLEDLAKVVVEIDDKVSSIETKAVNGMSSIANAVLAISKKPLS